MARYSRWVFILLALILSAAPLFAASTEEDDFKVAVGKLQIVPAFAEKNFADFIQKYPNSVHIPEAILDQAQARLKSGHAAGAIDLLKANQYRADKLAPQYAYWLGRAQFQNENYSDAAATFEQVWKTYPGLLQAPDSYIREADALTRLERYAQVVQLLEQTNGLFQQQARSGTKSDAVASGYVLLANAQLARGNTNGFDTTLRNLDTQNLTTDLTWQKNFLLAKRQQAQGQFEEALGSVSNLLATANPTNRAQGVTFQAAILEQMGNLEAAVNAYTNNLTGDTPPDLQRYAISKIAALELLQTNLPEAAQRLQTFLDQFSNAPTADLAALTLGEVQLKQALLTHDATLFAKALARFDSLTNSAMAGAAFLNRGWCLWNETNLTDSQAAFRAAAGRLPFSEQQAVARFKWADTQLQMNDFEGAVTNYDYITNYSALPGMNMNLVEQALYQSMRAALNEDNVESAAGTLERILAWFPKGLRGPSALLLTGQGLAEQKQPAAARQLFAEFERLYPSSSFLPEVRLAIARSYEEEANWDAAITNYVGWINVFATNSVFPDSRTNLPQAKFSIAWDNYMAGRETNALALFMDFIVQFPSSELSAQAQSWVGDYYFRQKDYLAAERSYQLVYQNTNLPASDITNLMAQARMMAGRAAMARFAYKEAIPYFTVLMTPDYPSEFQVQATMAYADATINQESTNKIGDLIHAIGSLQTITNTQGDTPVAALALGRMGDCYFEWGSKDASQYSNAAAAYRAVAEAAHASDAAKDESRFKLATVFQKQASLESGTNQTVLLEMAFNQYVEALEQGLHKDKEPSLSWTKRSGLAAAELAESLQEWQAMLCIYAELKILLPVTAPECDKKIAKALEHGARRDYCRLQ